MLGGDGTRACGTGRHGAATCVCVHEGVGVACGLVGGGAPKSIAVSVPPAVYTSNPSRLATKLAL